MTPIQLDPNHSVNTVADTTLAQAQANTRYALQVQVDTVNASRVADYEAQWKAYAAARDARPDATNLTVPVPQWGEAIFTDSRGWPYIDTAAVPVITPHTYVPPKTTPIVSIFGTAGAGNTQPEPFPGAELYKPLSLPSGRVFQRIA